MFSQPLDSLQPKSRYKNGLYHIHSQCPYADTIKSFIEQLGFLTVDKNTRIYTHNRRYRVYDTDSIIIGIPMIMKASWVNPEYSCWRRFELSLSQLFKDHACTAFKGAWMQQQAGISTVEPMAFWSYWRSPLQVERYLLYEKIPAEYSVLEFMRGKMKDLPEDQARQILDDYIVKAARLVAKLHRAGLRQYDLNPCNFLVTREESGSEAELVLIDTDNVRRTVVRIPVIKRFFDIMCFRRTNFDRAGRRLFLREYLADQYSEFWWKAMEFGRNGGNKPLRTLLKLLTGRFRRRD